ncbi:putative nucleotidyltransferase substrate binding domain-containing protein [Gordonia sp. NPDC003950]
MDDLATALGSHPPLDSLSDDELGSIASRATVVSFESGAQIVNGFTAVTHLLWVVLAGQVEIFNHPEPGADGPDEILGPGGIFGYSSLLTREREGPIAVAAGPVRVCQIPEDAVRPLFSGLAGARFLAGQLSSSRRRAVPTTAGQGTVEELISSIPVVASAEESVATAAERMTAAGQPYIVIPAPNGRFGVLTDRDIRVRCVAAGRGVTTPIGEVMSFPAVTVRIDASAAEVLTLIVDRGLGCVPVTGPGGELRGVVVPTDFVAVPAGPSMTLRRQVAESTTVTELQERARRMPYLVGDLVRGGQPAAEITRVLSLVHDAVMRRAIELVFTAAPELDPQAMTWLSLGSNARREPVLSSDVDSAVSLADDLGADEIARYRGAFAEVDTVLRGAGMRVDTNGAIASMPLFTRTHSQWRAAARTWLDAPADNKGMIFTSLLLDGRPIWGDPGLTAVAEVFGDLRSHPATLRMLLAEALSTPARLRSMRDVLARRTGTVDIKRHALTPLVNIARWGALAVGSVELDTRSRLCDAGASEVLGGDAATTLVEVFDVLQRIRLRYQLEQIERREDPSDVITLRRLSPLDRSLLAQAVREISAVQRRMGNVAQYAPVEDWGAGTER